MLTPKQRELAIGVVMVVAGAAYLLAGRHVPNKPGVDAATVPALLGYLMCLLGAVQLRTAFALGGEPEGGSPRASVDYGTTLKTVALIVAYAASLNAAGFLLASAVYLFVQFVVLTPADRKPAYVTYALIAIVTSVSVYVLFRYAFDLVLPVGLIDLD